MTTPMTTNARIAGASTEALEHRRGILEDRIWSSSATEEEQIECRRIDRELDARAEERRARHRGLGW